jgi:filamentous hemagglutinin family protein
MYSFKYWKLIFASFVFIGSSLFANCATGQQLKVDHTLGEESSTLDPKEEVIINETPSYLIKGGALRGNNLFHSFELFNVDKDHGVYFDINNRPGVARIISRVTGSSPSEILGVLGVDGGNADLFLINPNGILFGPNASLNLDGSFLASTASSVVFADTQYSAAEPSSFPLLSMNVPIGLSFRNITAPIVNQSQVLDPDEEESAGLQVKSGKTLTLVGGNITLESGFLTAPDGRINLASLARTGEVILDASSFAIDFKGEQSFGNIQLVEGSKISTIGIGSGDVNLRGRNIELTGGSAIEALNIGSEPGGAIRITASEDVLLEGTNSFGFPSFLASGTVRSGKGGDIAIRANKLALKDRALIQTSSSFTISRSGNVVPATGQAGSVTVTAKDLEVSGGSSILAVTYGMAMGGDVIVNASDSVNIFGVSSDNSASGLYTVSTPRSSGQAGNITLNTRFLRVADEGTISARSEGIGSAGNIEINASSIRLENSASLDAQTTAGFGNIKLNANDIVLRDNSKISTNATGTANGGNIAINTGVLVGFENSDIVANAFTGSGGRVEISAKGIFGLVPRTRIELEQLLGTTDPSQLPSSDITAISQSNPSLNGQVILNTPEVDPSKSLVELPTTVVDPDSLVAQNPCKRGSESEFTRSGRGGLPPSVSQDFNSDATQVGLVEPVQSSTANRQQTKALEGGKTSFLASAATPIAPAQGWVFNDKGKVVLVSHNSMIANPQRLKTNPAGCPVP